MIQDLKQIEYSKGVLDKDMNPRDISVKVWREAKIPVEVRKAVNEESLLNLGGVYGDIREELLCADCEEQFSAYERYARGATYDGRGEPNGYRL